MSAPANNLVVGFMARKIPGRPLRTFTLWAAVLYIVFPTTNATTARRTWRLCPWERMMQVLSGMTIESCTYCLTRRVRGSFSDVVVATRAALASEGFGVLTEIDVKATLAAKLEVTTRPYLILGACNPALAHRALLAEPGVGTLLPCNVVVAENDDGTIAVAAVDPRAMFAVVNNPALTPIVEDVRARLQRVMDALPGPSDV